MFDYYRAADASVVVRAACKSNQPDPVNGWWDNNTPVRWIVDAIMENRWHLRLVDKPVIQPERNRDRDVRL